MIELCEFPLPFLALYAHIISVMLNDPCHAVLHVTVQTLGRLDRATLAQHADAVVVTLRDSPSCALRCRGDAEQARSGGPCAELACDFVEDRGHG